MSVATRLQGAFAMYIALLAAVIVYHVRTIERAVQSGHDLTEIATRLRVSATDELSRVRQMDSDAEKFLVTRDRGYLEKFREAEGGFSTALRHLDSLPLSAPERAALSRLTIDWGSVRSRAARLDDVEFATPEAGAAIVSHMQDALDEARIDNQQLAAASQDAMSRELAASEHSARSAERVSWLAALGALLLSLSMSAMLVRSIVGPLGRLAQGTREVSAGRFAYRLDASGSDEFGQVARDFNSMTERLDELDRMKRDFVAKVSHDLKTPLSSMQETIGAILDGVAGPVTPKQRQLLELNLESGHRLFAMLSKLLDLSRIEAGLEPDFQMLDMNQLVKRSIERAERAGAPRGIELSFAESTGRVLLRGDADGLTQVVDNLLENAVKFSPAGGHVQLRLTPWKTAASGLTRGRAVVRAGRLRGSAVLITVSDEGPGVPEDERERIFSRFYQTEAGRAAHGKGVGLGLTICREIVSAHGGEIWVTDNEPRGSTFCVLLPGAVRPSETPADPTLAIASRPIA